MIEYTTSLDRVAPQDLVGFFEGWPRRPSAEAHLRLLRGSELVLLARDTEAGGRVVGFVTAIGDGVLSAYLPLLEVLPEYRRQGIGTELVRRVLELLPDRYMVDITCDEDLVAFYERLGLRRATAMSRRNRDAIPAS